MTEPPGLGETISAQVRRYRLAKQWSVRRLAEECERLGMPTLTEASLGNLERGQTAGAKRGTRRVLLEELVVLAKALDVPPMLLAFPFDQVRDVQVVPNLPVPTWDAAEWFAGRAPFPSTPDRPEEWREHQETFERGAVAFHLWDHHQGEVKAWQQATWDQEMARRQAENAHDQESRDALLKSARAAELNAGRIANALWEVRRRMRQHGILTPDLPEALRHIDTERSPLERAIARAYEEGGSSGGPDQAS